MKKTFVGIAIFVMFSMVGVSFAAEPVLFVESYTHQRALNSERLTGQSFVLPQEKLNSLELFITKMTTGESSNDFLIVSICKPDYRNTMFGNYSPDGDPLQTVRIAVNDIIRALDEQTKETYGQGDNAVVGVWFSIPLEATLVPNTEYVFQMEFEGEGSFMLYGISVIRPFPDWLGIEKSDDSGYLVKRHDNWNIMFRMY
jgi:hypothetical protein